MILLPFPSSLLAGHTDGKRHWDKIKATKEHRAWASHATKAELRTRKGTDLFGVTGDIGVAVRFVPPNNRGDRINFPNRMKPYFDGIADALGVNDSRFLPSYHFGKACAPGHVLVEISAGEGSCTVSAHRQPSEYAATAVDKKTARAEPRKRRSGHDHNAVRERQA